MATSRCSPDRTYAISTRFPGSSDGLLLHAVGAPTGCIGSGAAAARLTASLFGHQGHRPPGPSATRAIGHQGHRPPGPSATRAIGHQGQAATTPRLGDGSARVLCEALAQPGLTPIVAIPHHRRDGRDGPRIPWLFSDGGLRARRTPDTDRRWRWGRGRAHRRKELHPSRCARRWLAIRNAIRNISGATSWGLPTGSAVYGH
jgi:hypothetical protein